MDGIRMIAGTGWPNGSVNKDNIFALPGDLLLLSSEHWHVKEAIQRGKRVVYRIVPLPEQRMAVLHWSPVRYVDAIMDQLRADNETQSLVNVITDIVPWNEPDLQDERGDSNNDFEDLAERYALIGSFGLHVIQILRDRLPTTVKIHWPAFTPNADHQAVDHVEYWREAALSCDIIDFHGYDTLDKVKLEHTLYKEAFPDRELECTEWHGKGSLEEERLILAYFQEQKIRSKFFIYRWYNAPGWWDDSYDIYHNPDRYSLFLNQEESETPEEPTVVDLNEPLRNYGLQKAAQLGLPIGHVDRQMQQESGWKHWRDDGSLVTSRSGALGVCQIIPRWHPTVDIQDPYACLDYALEKLMLHSWDIRNSYKLALMDYNWGPGNTNNWINKGSDDTQIRAETRHYLDVVLGDGWPDMPFRAAPPVEGNVEFVVGAGIRNKMDEHEDEPATHEIYVKQGGENMYSHAFGKSGAQYVYIFSTNSVYRFPAD